VKEGDFIVSLIDVKVEEVREGGSEEDKRGIIDTLSVLYLFPTPYILSCIQGQCSITGKKPFS
jgi:hypothetical protein